MRENVGKSMFYLAKERGESRYSILFTMLIMLFIIFYSSRVYATGNFEVKNSLQGNEVTSFENSIYQMKEDENGYTTGIVDCFNIIEEYTSYDEMHRYLDGGGDYGDWYCIVDNTIDYKGKYFMLCTKEYVGRNIKMENLGQFEYVDRFQEGTYETYIYLLEIANNGFKKDNGKHSYFEIVATDIETNEKYLNKLEIEFRGQRPEEPAPEEPKPEETKPEETKPEETKPEETKPEETKPDETTSTDNKVQNQHKLDNEPKTGIINIVTLVSIVIVVSSICFVICKKKMYK